jgi:hypothetical protein
VGPGIRKRDGSRDSSKDLEKVARRRRRDGSSMKKSTGDLRPPVPPHTHTHTQYKDEVDISTNLH